MIIATLSKIVYGLSAEIIPASPPMRIARTMLTVANCNVLG